MHLRKRALLVAAATLSAVILTFGLAGPASAATTTGSDAPPTSPPTVTASAPMTIDCSTLKPAGRKYAIEHNVNICGVLDHGLKAGNGSVTPNANPVVGDCGTASINGWTLGSGRAYFEWKVVSSTGAIWWYSTSIVYSGASGGGTLSFSGAWPGISAAGGAPGTPGSGWASAYLGGSVTTDWADCTIGYPSMSLFVG